MAAQAAWAWPHAFMGRITASLRAYSMEQTQNFQALETEIVVVHVDYLTLAERHVKDARSSRTHAL